MLNEKQQQAKQLYFQTDLSKTQIAGLLNVSRRSVHYWIQQNNWDRLKVSATHLPAMLAENCYLLIGQYQRHLLSEDRIMQPITHIEAETLHKLALTTKKLKNHSTLNESMEMFAHFMERVSKKSPELAAQIAPFVEEHIENWASLSQSQFKPDNFNEVGYLSTPGDHPHANEEVRREFIKERSLDSADIIAWDDEIELHNQLEYFEQKLTTLTDTEGHPEHCHSGHRRTVTEENAEGAIEEKQQLEKIIQRLKSRIRNLPKDDSFPPPICHPESTEGHPEFTEQAVITQHCHPEERRNSTRE